MERKAPFRLVLEPPAQPWSLLTVTCHPQSLHSSQAQKTTPHS